MSCHIVPPKLGAFGLPEPDPSPALLVLREMEANEKTARRIIQGKEPKLKFRLRMPDGRASR